MKKIISFVLCLFVFSACLAGPDRAKEMELRQALKASLREEQVLLEKQKQEALVPVEGAEELEGAQIESDGELSVRNATEEDDARLQAKNEAENKVIDASFALADFYYQKEEWAKAVKMYESILERKWDNFMALNNLFAVYEDHLQKKKLAADVMDTFHTIYGANMEVTRDAVRIYLKTGQVEKAENALKFFESKLSAQDRLKQEAFLKSKKNEIFKAKAEQNR